MGGLQHGQKNVFSRGGAGGGISQKAGQFVKVQAPPRGKPQVSNRGEDCGGSENFALDRTGLFFLLRIFPSSAPLGEPAKVSFFSFSTSLPFGRAGGRTLPWAYRRLGVQARAQATMLKRPPGTLSRDRGRWSQLLEIGALKIHVSHLGDSARAHLP